MSPRVAEQKLYAQQDYQSYISLPVFGANGVGTSEIAQNHTEFKVFPNPASESVFVKSVYAESFEVVVFSINGQELIRNQYHTNLAQIDLKNLKSGVYMMKIIDSNDFSEVHKIIIR
jgi:hypothetical protein